MKIFANKSFSYSAIEIANKIIASCDDSVGDIISNLKLQKMLYYMQGFFIAVFDKKLFNEPIVAWTYGPVVEAAYDHFKKFGKGAILLNSEDKIIELPSKEFNLFNSVMNEFGQFSAIKLMEMTHKEPPWKETYSESSPGKEITYDKLKKYFATQIE